MLRPKSVRMVSVKMPDELHCDLAEQAERETTAIRVRNPLAADKTVSDVIKDCIEFRMTLMKGLHLGYYRLRQVRAEGQPDSGRTMRPLV